MSDKCYSGLNESSNVRKLSKYKLLKIAIIYFLTGVLWILFSNRVLLILIKNEDVIMNLKVIVELGYIAAVAYLFCRIAMNHTKSVEEYSKRLNIIERDSKKLNDEILVKEVELNTKNEELQNKEYTIRALEQKFRSIFEVIIDTVWEWDFVSGKIHFTERLTEILGYSGDEEFDYTKFLNIIHPIDRHNLVKSVEDHISGRLLYFQCELRIRSQIGYYKWILCMGKGLKDENGNVNRVIGSLNDITERKESEDKLNRLTHYDGLTELQSRILFEKRLSNVLIEANNTGKQGEILFIDLDDFKKVNDAQGHDYGDHLIKLTAQMLNLTVGENDEICRFGGDEFIILHPRSENGIDGSELAKQILDIFTHPFEIGEEQIYVSVSIGIACYPNDGHDVSTILKNADAAMYEAKKIGKNTYCFYNRKVISEIIKRNELEKRMRTAIENNELYLYYQPQLDVKTGEITSMEALIRWNCPDYGIIMPFKFISIAEESGFIVQIGEWILKNVCAQIKEWKDKDYSFDYIAINISPKQLKCNGFIDMVKEVLIESSVGANDIEFEITENVLIEPFHQSIQVLTELQHMGIKIALDDFGTGYSSLNYLRMLPINSIKIDKTFIDNICTNSDVISIVDGIISLAHKMNLTVTAEGVEVEEQLNILKEKQCDKIQGYFISRPLSPEGTEGLLKRQSWNS